MAIFSVKHHSDYGAPSFEYPTYRGPGWIGISIFVGTLAMIAIEAQLIVVRQAALAASLLVPLAALISVCIFRLEHRALPRRSRRLLFK
jgi:hypothetical protein